MDSRAVATCLARTSSRGCHRMTSSSSFSIRSASCVSLLSSSSSAAPCEANDSPSFSSSPCVTPSSRHDELRKATFQSLKQQQQQQQQRMTYSSVSSSSSSSSLQDKVASTTSKWSKEMTRNFSSSFSASPPPPPPGIGGNVNVDKNSASNGSSSKPKKTKVLLKETPRAKKQKLLLNGHSPSPLMNVTSSSSSSSSSSLFLNADQSLSLNGEHSHPALHLIKGGTPCDPAPPPYRLAEYGEESLYTLVLLRHGESEWNAQNRYTGWCDVNLTKKGEMEARTAGRLLYENGIEIDHAFTSVLKRASFSCNMALNMAKQHWVPITKSWRLNERHYGALQGFNKDTAWQELGLDQELVMQMRRSYDVRPPRMEDTHEFWHGNDRRYAKLSPEQLERTRAESLKDTAERIMPFINTVVTPSMRAGNKCLIVAHANTIRTLIKQIDSISDEDIKGMTIPTGIPLLYRLDKNFKPVDPQVELEFRYMVEPKGYTWATSRAHGFHGVYLGDVERLRDIQIKRDVTNRDWQRIILRNIGKSLGWDMDDALSGTVGAKGPRVLETRQLWWQLHKKMQTPGYSNMLLLVNMFRCLEELMYERKQKYITKAKYEQMVNKIHLDTEGKVVEPFVALADRDDHHERQRLWYESLALDLEEECLIK